MRYQLAHYSLRGARPTNEDRVAVAERDNAAIMALADGLGGHAGGDLAAETLTRIVVRAFQAVRTPLIERPSAFLALAILQAHNAIVQLGRTRAPPLEPRTTCVVCLVQNGYAYWAHVGDSRLYHFRAGRVLARTLDHSTIEQLREAGLLSEAEMGEHPQKSRLLKCVGGPHKPTISLGRETLLLYGDVLLLCSDGLWEALAPDELYRCLQRSSLDEAVEEMLFRAERKMRDACDNVSAIALRWEDRTPAGLPLQGNDAMQVDGDALWENATHINATQRLQSRRRGAGRTAIENEIREIEEYLKQLDTRFKRQDTS